MPLRIQPHLFRTATLLVAMASSSQRWKKAPVIRTYICLIICTCVTRGIIMKFLTWLQLKLSLTHGYNITATLMNGEDKVGQSMHGEKSVWMQIPWNEVKSESAFGPDGTLPKVCIKIHWDGTPENYSPYIKWCGFRVNFISSCRLESGQACTQITFRSNQ